MGVAGPFRRHRCRCSQLSHQVDVSVARLAQAVAVADRTPAARTALALTTTYVDAADAQTEAAFSDFRLPYISKQTEPVELKQGGADAHRAHSGAQGICFSCSVCVNALGATLVFHENWFWGGAVIGPVGYLCSSGGVMEMADGKWRGAVQNYIATQTVSGRVAFV